MEENVDKKTKKLIDFLLRVQYTVFMFFGRKEQYAISCLCSGRSESPSEIQVAQFPTFLMNLQPLRYGECQQHNLIISPSA